MKQNKLHALRDDEGMSKLKIGIIGVGGIAKGRHIPAILKQPEKTKLIALSDVNEDNLKETAESLGVTEYSTDYHEILDKVDAVVICTPNKFHAAITIAALEAGCHVLCEKPMAMTTLECEQMIAASEKADKKLAIAYHYRHTDVAKLAKTTMQSGEIGEVLVTRVKALRQRKVPGWGVFTNKALQGGGSLIDYGCHLIDMALWLLGDVAPIEVTGRTYNALARTPDQVNDWGSYNHETFNVDDHVTSYLTFENGASLALECSWAANIKADEMHLSLSGDKSGMNVYPFELYYPKNGYMHTSEAQASHDEDLAGERQMVNFIESCLGESELVVKPQEAMLVNQVIEAIYESSETGQSIKLM